MSGHVGPDHNNISLKQISAEFLATLLLVFAGCGVELSLYRASGSTSALPSSSYVLPTAVGWGLAYASLIQIFSHLCGAHMNPAVSFALWVSHKITLKLAIVFVITQGNNCSCLQ